jgi:uncharacterized membrane protein
VGERLILLGMFALVGVLMALIARPMIAGRIPSNHWYGFRTPKTLSSDEIWYPANAYSGRTLYVAGLVMFIGSVVLFPVSPFLSKDQVGFAGLILTCVPLTWSVIKSFQYIKKL